MVAATVRNGPVRPKSARGGINGGSGHGSSGMQFAAARRKPCWTGTPEIYFAKPIDNSRLVKVEDPRRSREMRQFGVALGCLFLLVMTYTWQHFKAIEYGYKIESLKNAARRTGRREPRAAAGRSVAARPGAHRPAGAADGTAVAAGRPGDSHGFRSPDAGDAGDGQRSGIGSLGAVEF